MSDVVLLAPVEGWLTPLDEVPDPVFADRMMGEGIAIDPLGRTISAPADAMVVSIPDTAHAVTLRLSNGAELLIHIGLETVALGGEGFRALTSEGSMVRAGDPLIEVDLGSVARRARSLVTPLVVANEGFLLALEPASRQVRTGDKLGVVRGAADRLPEVDGDPVERAVRIDAAHGLHARPAARIAALAKLHRAEIRVAFRGKTASARSTVALMSLGIKQGDEVRLSGRGDAAHAAINAIAKLVDHLGEMDGDAGVPIRRMGAVCASPGLSIGTIFQLRARDLEVARDGGGAGLESQTLVEAIEASIAGLHGGKVGDLAAAHRELLEDPELISRAEDHISSGRSAAFAWRAACSSAREALIATGDPLLAERAADLLDIERQVIERLVHGKGTEPVLLPSDAILIAPDLLPSEILALDKTRVAGICTAEGGPTSHVAILAAAAGIPMIVAAGPDVLDLPDGAAAILDADQCTVEAAPTPERLSQAEARMQERRAKRAVDIHDAQQPCYTADGIRIEVFANLSSVEDAEAAVEAGAEGCGLLRTEFLAVRRKSAPDEEEQRKAYAAIAAALGDRPLIVRTFDIGADKQVSYLGTRHEENPALGLRGIRLGLARTDLLATQIRAILRAVPSAQRRIMLPMISDVEEFRTARAALAEAQSATGVDGDTQLGIMVETPASALLASELAAEADFLSVGTNDLAQYALAADRTNADVSPLLDAFHPAVLRLIRLAAEGALANGRWIGVCGGLASNPLAVPVLIGLGVTELSAAPAAVPAVKATVRRLNLNQCRALAVRVCSVATAQEARAIAAEGLA